MKLIRRAGLGIAGTVAVAGLSILPAGTALACGSPPEAPSSPPAARLHDVPITPGAKVTFTMTGPAELGRDGRYHEVILELINPTPGSLRGGSVSIALYGEGTAYGQTRYLQAKSVRLKELTEGGTLAVPLQGGGCEPGVNGLIAEQLDLPAGSARTIQLRLALAMSTPPALSSMSVAGHLSFDLAPEHVLMPSVRIDPTIVPAAKAAVGEQLTDRAEASEIPADERPPVAPATPPATAPFTPTRTALDEAGSGDLTGLAVAAAVILLISSLAAVVQLRRTAPTR